MAEVIATGGRAQPSALGGFGRNSDAITQILLQSQERKRLEEEQRQQVEAILSNFGGVGKNQNTFNFAGSDPFAQSPFAQASPPSGFQANDPRTAIDAVRGLLSSPAGVKAFINNQAAVSKAFELLQEPETADAGILAGSAAQIQPQQARGFRGEDLARREELRKAVGFDAFTDVTNEGFVTDRETREGLEEDDRKGAEALRKEAEELLRQPEPATEGRSKKSKLERAIEALDSTRLSTEKEEVKIQALAKARREINALRATNPRKAAATEAALQNSPVFTEAARAEKIKAIKDERNAKLDDQIANLRADEILKDDKTAIDVSTAAKDILFSNGVASMEEFTALPLEQQRKIRKDIGKAASKTNKIVNVSAAKALIDKNGDSAGTGVFVTEYDPETGELTGRVHVIDDERGLIPSSLVAKDQAGVGLERSSKAKLEQQVFQIGSAVNALEGLFRNQLESRTDQEINRILTVPGGFSQALGTTLGALDGFEGLFFDRESFFSEFSKNPSIARIVDKLAPDSASFYAEYAYTMYKVAVAASEGGGRALSDKDLERVKPMIKISEAKQLRSTIKTSLNVLRSDRKFKADTLGKRRSRVGAMSDSSSLVIDEKGNPILPEDIKEKTKPKESQTLNNRVEELF